MLLTTSAWKAGFLRTPPVNVLFQISTCSASRDGDSLRKLPRREYVLSIRYEDSQDELCFRRVEALRVSHYKASTVEMISLYDRVTDLGETPWLADVRQQLKSSRESTVGLRHIGLYLDDGPFYEFVCHEFSATITGIA